MGTDKNAVWYWVWLFCLLSSCRPDRLSPEQYARWIGDPENGLLQQRQVAVFDLALQYWPPAFRAWRELDSDDEASPSKLDSLTAVYGKSLYFVFTISPTAGKATGDVMYSGLKDYNDYDARIRALSFGMAEYWTLKTPDGTVMHPVLTHLEHTYSLTDYHKLHLVFVPPDSTLNLYDVSHWDVTYRDEIFNTGLHHFVFKKGNWEGLPEVKMLQN